MALFFIDDISSYRPDADGKAPYLLTAFERLLKERIEAVLASLNDHEVEYRAYLEASLADLSACHAGYFSQYNSDSDEEMAKEVDAILADQKITMGEFLGFAKKHDVKVSLADFPKIIEEAKKAGLIK